MQSLPVPFLWLCGPSGVGKTTLGWEIFTQLSRAGIKTAYLDLDQIALCYPAPPDDPVNQRLRAANLAAVWPAYRAAGAQCLIASGVVDSRDEVRRHADLLSDTRLTVCRLRAGHDELRARFLRRGWLTHMVDDTIEYADALDRSDFADLCIDTDGLAVGKIARLVRDGAGGWPGGIAPITGATAEPPVAGPAVPPAAARDGAMTTGAPVPVLWLCGPTAVGKSTVGYQVFSQVNRARVRAAYLDLSQLGWCRPVPDDDPENHRVKAANLARIWPGLRSAGARCLVMSGAVPDRDTVRRYADALPGAALTLCRLRAGPDRLTERILRRGRGGGPPIAGDELVGRPVKQLHRAARQAARVAEELDRREVGDLWVDTDDRSVAELADLVRAAAGGWPDLR